MNAPVLEARGLRAGFGAKPVVHEVDLALGEREILLLLGHNGAGKTTLLRTLFGLLPALAGAVWQERADATRRTPAQNVACGLAFVPQGHGVFRTLTVRRNLELAAISLPGGVRARDEHLERVHAMFPILAERAGQVAGTLSGGQQQMLAIGMALMHAPRILLLDEPSIGLAPILVDKVMESIAAIRATLGTAVLLVEQNVKQSLPLADRVAILKQGRKVYDGAPAAFADRRVLLDYF
ncbi:ABC transporter ATP-binding protein [Xenophilus azovorans]|uniref:ABC transporter ATP-binding protein n=1 Tax=Xenophilus azovorans TaxID=151755 RepID=UPI00068A6ED5|nr:ABC transporter ATP-binding protein [Xenophilus azovorans]